MTPLLTELFAPVAASRSAHDMPFIIIVREERKP
jgi:hypothetical protein